MTLQSVSRAGMAVVCAGLLVLLLISMVLTNPTNLGPGGVTLWFLGFWLVLATNLAFLKYELVMRYGSETAKSTGRKTKLAALRHGVLIGAGLTVLLALSSLQQLDIRDIALVTVLLILIEFYARTRR